MDYLRTLGSAAASSLLQKSGIALPFSLGEKVSSFEGKSIWSLHDAIKRDDSSRVSVFTFDSTQPGKRALLPLAKNALRKLRTTRHPNVLKFVDVVETDTVIHIVTERVEPLSKALNSSSQARDDDLLLWGLHYIAIALSFVNESCASIHGNVRIDSIFVTTSGEWRLGGFEVLSNPKEEDAVLFNMGGLLPDTPSYASPETAKSGWSVLKELPPSSYDAYCLGLLIHALFNPSQPFPSNSATTPPPRGSIPSSLFVPFKRLLNPSTKARLTTKGFLDIGSAVGGFFAENRLVKICKGLDEFALTGETEKKELLRTLRSSSDRFPPSFVAYLVLPSLLMALQHAGATAPDLLPLILHLGTRTPPDDYNNLIVSPLVKMFASPDRGTRMALLDHFSEFADKIDSNLVVSDVWPHLQTGFTDTVAVIREATIRSITLIAPKLSARILNNDLLRHLARAQSDPEPSIRTNTAILLGRLAPTLSPTSRRKVLVPAFSRAIKDVFVHARVAGLMAFMACGELFEPEDVAKGVLPVVAGALVDGHKLVREQAFKTIEYFVKRLEEHARSMPETDQAMDPANRGASQTAQATLVNSAAGAAGALAGWAISSIGKKLTAGDMQTDIGGAEKLTSGPSPTPLGTTNGGSLLSHTTSHPSSDQSIPDKKKAMQLGTTKVHSEMPGSLVDEWVTQANAGAGTATSWGGDLMDVNADADDWSAFETASVHGSVNNMVELEANDLWGNDFVSDNFGAASAKAPVAMVQQRPSLVPELSTASSRPASVASRGASDDDWDTAETKRSQNPKTPAAPSMLGMSKEEKAREMSRRREERKQRIAQLKEQKNKPGTKA